MIKREKCVVCLSSNLEHLHTFEKMPTVPHISNKLLDKGYNQVWSICKNCGCIQLTELVELSELYAVSHNGVIGETWKKHNKFFSEYIMKQNPSKILEIGGGNLSIANNIPKDNISKYKIYDINCYECSPAIIEFKHEFFMPDNNIEVNEEYDTIILSHVVEHLYKPMDYFKKFNKILSNNGKIIFSIPNIVNGLIKKYTNALNFEHTYLINKENLNYMMEQNGFKLMDIYNYTDLNFFAVYQKMDEAFHLLDNAYEKNKQIFTEYLDFHYKNIEYLNTELNKFKSRDKYLFGGGPFSQFLIYMGLNIVDIKAILDEDPKKQSHQLCGSNLYIIDPKTIKDIGEPVVILQAASYTEEIAKRLLEINPNTQIIV